MEVFSINVFKRFFKSRDKPKNYYSSAGGFFFGSTWSGKTVNEKTAMQITTVYACVRILSETIASLPLHTYKYTDMGKEKDYTHPLYYILHDAPNDEMTSFVFRETLMSHLLLWGNAYTQIIRDGRGRVVSLYPLLPDRMTVDRNKNGMLIYSYRKDTGECITLSSDNVLHIPGLGFDGVVGYSPIAMVKNAVGLAIATEEYGSKFFANSGNPSGVLEHPGQLKDPSRVRDSWNEVYGGSSNAHRVAVLEEGLSFKPISIPPEQAQFLQTRKFQITEICRIFRIAPHLVADLEKSSFSNIENQSMEFVKYTIDPWLVRLEQSFNKALLLPSERSKYFIKFNVNGLLRGDYASRMQGYQAGIQNGFLSPNDIRELEDMNKISDGDIYMANGNMLKLSDVGAFIKQNKEVEM